MRTKKKWASLDFDYKGNKKRTAAYALTLTKYILLGVCVVILVVGSVMSALGLKGGSLKEDKLQLVFTGKTNEITQYESKIKITFLTASSYKKNITELSGDLTIKNATNEIFSAENVKVYLSLQTGGTAEGFFLLNANGSLLNADFSQLLIVYNVNAVWFDDETYKKVSLRYAEKRTTNEQQKSENNEQQKSENSVVQDGFVIDTVSIPYKAYAGRTDLTKVIIADNVQSIGDSAFSGCTNLTSITIPNSVTSIGEGAFSGCSSLQSITLPFIGNRAGVTSTDTFQYPLGYIFGTDGYTGGTSTYQSYYGSSTSSTTDEYYYIPSSLRSVTVTGGNILHGAFDGCSGLTSITIPDSVTSIGNRAFSGCRGLTSITIPNSVTSIGKSAFRGCSGLTSITLPDSVTSIGDSAFYDCSGLTSITIPDSVTSIGYNAFSGCSGLTSITIPDSVTSIGDHAFYYCVGLTNITIPDSVTSIGNWAFDGCSGLTSITIPDSVTSIGNGAFWGCSGLTSITVNPKNTKYHSAGNCLIETATKTLIAGCKNSVIPTDGSVTSIGWGAFSNCSGLTSITIPNSVTSIGWGAFDGCSSLESITLPFIGNRAGVTSTDTYQYPLGYVFGTDGYTGGTSTYQPYYGSSTSSTTSTTYYIPSSLRSVTVTGGNILYGAFYGCSGLTSITIGNGVTSIGEDAFSGCSSLQSITLPFIGNRAGVTSTDTYQYPLGYVFGTRSYTGGTGTTQYYYGSSTSSTTHEYYYIPSSLRSVTVTGGNILHGAFYNCSGLTSITIPESVTSIGKYTFYGCSGLTSITIGNGVTSIGEYAFSGCSGLTSITIPDSVTSIGEYAFSGCSGLTSVTIGNGVTSIGGWAFDGCSGLTSITIPDSVTSIGDGAFYQCTSLTSVTIGNGVTSIGESAFYQCTSLTSITIPDSVTSIGEYAFSHCTSLTSITIGNGVKRIWYYAFYGCYKLVEVYNKSALSITKGNSDYGYVGYYAKEIYTEPYTSKLSIDENGYTLYTDGEEVSLIGYTGTDTELTLPSYVTEIYQYAFRGCTSLTSITIGSGVTSIVDYAFEGCTSLTSITIPDSVTSIGYSAFSGCSGLTSITFQGTKAQWNAIGKRYDWDYTIGAYTVYCTDGNISE